MFPPKAGIFHRPETTTKRNCRRRTGRVDDIAACALINPQLRLKCANSSYSCECPPNDSEARTKLGDANSGECVREPQQTSCSSRTSRTMCIAYSTCAAANSMRATCIGVLQESVRLAWHTARIQTHCSSPHVETTWTPFAHSPAQTQSGASAIGSTSPHSFTLIASHCAQWATGISCSESNGSQMSCKCWQWTTCVQCRRAPASDCRQHTADSTRSSRQARCSWPSFWPHQNT